MGTTMKSNIGRKKFYHLINEQECELVPQEKKVLYLSGCYKFLGEEHPTKVKEL